MQTPESQTEPPELASLRALAEMADAAQEVSGLVAASFSETLRRIVARAVGDGPEAQQALADGGFVMNGTTVVMRLNPETSFVEFFCDIGQPDRFALEEAYRAALEANLCRTFPGITLGVHPESGRLVATLALNGLMVDNEEFCMTILEMLTQRAREIRDSGVVALED